MQNKDLAVEATTIFRTDDDDDGQSWKINYFPTSNNIIIIYDSHINDVYVVTLKVTHDSGP